MVPRGVVPVRHRAARAGAVRRRGCGRPPAAGSPGRAGRRRVPAGARRRSRWARFRTCSRSTTARGRCGRRTSRGTSGCGTRRRGRVGWRGGRRRWCATRRRCGPSSSASGACRRTRVHAIPLAAGRCAPASDALIRGRPTTRAAPGDPSRRPTAPPRALLPLRRRPRAAQGAGPPRRRVPPRPGTGPRRPSSSSPARAGWTLGAPRHPPPRPGRRPRLALRGRARRRPAVVARGVRAAAGRGARRGSARGRQRPAGAARGARRRGALCAAR